MKKFLAVIGLMSLAVASAQTTSPFGIPMNANLAQLKSLGAVENTKAGAGRYTLAKVPTPNAAFENYNVAFSNKHGICYITGIGKDIKTDDYGTTVKDAFAAIRQVLRQKYGNDKNFDFLHADSIWDEDKDWMMGLKQKERTLASFWDREEKSQLPKDIGEIVFSANALYTDTGYLLLSYRAPNYDACMDDINKPSTNGL